MPINDPEKYREYAAHCKRLAERARPEDKDVLMKIAEAWEQQAKLAEGRERRN